MRRPVLSLMTLLPLAVAFSACDDGPTTTTKVTSTPNPAFQTTVIGSQFASDSASFGAGVRPAGRSGLINVPTNASAAPRVPGNLQATVQLQIQGAQPGAWAERKMFDPAIETRLVARLPRVPTMRATVSGTGLALFSNLAESSYHFIYDDGKQLGASNPDANGESHIDLVGFYVSDPNKLYVYQGNTKNGPFAFTYDLYWDTKSFPRTQTLDPTHQRGAYDPKHAASEFYTYDDEFTFTEKSAAEPADYRIIVYDNSGFFHVQWFSAWQQPDANGRVHISWNGYTNESGSGENNPSESDPGNHLLDPGPYVYAIQFKGRGGLFPATIGDPRLYNPLTDGLIGNFFGSSQFYGFQLKHGTKKTSSGASPSPSTSPSPGASPSPLPSIPPPVFTDN